MLPDWRAGIVIPAAALWRDLLLPVKFPREWQTVCYFPVLLEYHFQGQTVCYFGQAVCYF